MSRQEDLERAKAIARLIVARKAIPCSFGSADDYILALSGENARLEFRIAEIKHEHEQALLTANDALTKDGEGLTLSQRTALVKAIREVK